MPLFWIAKSDGGVAELLLARGKHAAIRESARVAGAPAREPRRRDRDAVSAYFRFTERKRRSMSTSAMGPWDSALPKLQEWDSKWADNCFEMATNPWTNGILPRKFIELVCVGLNAACTNLNPEGTRRHIRDALQSGATREEILFVLKCASVVSFHSCSLGAPILVEEAEAAGAQQHMPTTGVGTPACDKMKEIGQWNTAWDPIFNLDPLWTDRIHGHGYGNLWERRDVGQGDRTPECRTRRFLHAHVRARHTSPYQECFEGRRSRARKSWRC